MESALQKLNMIRQDLAMIEQFSGLEPVEESEWRDWQHIRRAAVSRRLNRPEP